MRDGFIIWFLKPWNLQKSIFMWLKDPGYKLYGLSCCVWNFVVQDHAVCDVLDIWIAHVTCGNLLENVLEKKTLTFSMSPNIDSFYLSNQAWGETMPMGPRTGRWVFQHAGSVVVLGRFMPWGSLRMLLKLGLPPTKTETEFESTSWEFLNKQFKAPVKNSDLKNDQA